MVPTLTEIKPYLHEAISLADEIGVFATTEMIPFCFMEGYEKHVVEPALPDIEIRAIEYSENFREIKKLSRVKTEDCRLCKHYPVCEGVTNRYARYMGTSELSPIISNC